MFYRLTLLLYTVLAALGLGVLLAGQVQASPTAVVPPSPLTPGLHNLVEEADGVRFSLHTPTYTLTADGVLELPGLETETWREPGAPLVPIYQTWLAVPAGAEVKIEVRPLGLRYQTMPGVRATAAGQPVPDPLHPDQYIGLTSGPTTLATAETTPPSFFPPLTYDLSPVQQSGDVSLVSLRLYPVQYDPASQQVRHNQELAVVVRFVGGNRTPTPTADLSPNQAQWLGQVLNPSHVWLAGGADTLRQWRTPNASAVRLPVGQTAYRIAITEEGIHQVTYAQLAILGLTGSLNPAQIQMMHNGRTVGHQHVDTNNNNLFDAGDAIRFYGWPFDGSRFEQFYTTENVFWLWVNGTASPIATASAAPSGGAGTAVHTTYATHTFGEDDVFWRTSLYVTHWADSPNEPDYFFWKRLYPHSTEDPNRITLTLPITLPHPAPVAGQATFTAEVNTVTNYDTPAKNHEVWLDVNGLGGVMGTLPVIANRNVTMQVAQASLASNGVNTVTLYVPEANPIGSPCNAILHDCLMLNELRVGYTRLLVADGDQLAFGTAETGLLDVAVSGFSNNNLLLWEITDRYQPVRLTGGTVTGAQNQLSFSRHMGGDGRFIALTTAQVRPTTGQISRYTVANTQPSGGADWVAITHADFYTQAQRLADYRASATGGSYRTAVLNVQDLINQFGYGFPSPTGIHTYLQEAFTSWETPPRYVLLVGSADYNPRLLDCAPVCHPAVSVPYDFSQHLYPQVPTYLTFRDRFQGLTPADFEYSLLVGDDLLPDLAIGRLSVHTLAEAQVVVDKIIQYETHQLTPADWQYNMVLLHDNADGGGVFTAGLTIMGSYIPPVYNQDMFGLVIGNNPAETAAVRQQLTTTIGTDTPKLLAYRGHGSVDRWANEGLLNNSYINSTHITNAGRPFVTLSMDCLDGNFAYPGWNSLSRMLMIQDNGRGGAAHWSSTGLGYDYEHTVLANAFAIAMFDLGYTALGDAINHAKTVYTGLPFSTSELYAFTLQGDPAMQMYRPEWNIAITAPSATLFTETEFGVTLALSNTGIYPSRPIVTYTLPAHITYVSHTTTLTNTMTLTDNGGQQQLVFVFDERLAYEEQTQIALQLEASAEGSGLSTAEVRGTGSDMSPNTGRIAHALLAAQEPQVEWSILLLAPNETIEVGQLFDTEFLIQNSGPHHSRPTVVYTLPAGMTYHSHQADIGVDVTQTTLLDNRLELRFEFTPYIGNSAVVSTQVRLRMGNNSGTAVAEVSGTGRDLSPETGRRATALLRSSAGWRIYLPFVQR